MIILEITLEGAGHPLDRIQNLNKGSNSVINITIKTTQTNSVACHNIKGLQQFYKNEEIIFYIEDSQEFIHVFRTSIISLQIKQFSASLYLDIYTLN